MKENLPQQTGAEVLQRPIDVAGEDIQQLADRSSLSSALEEIFQPSDVWTQGMVSVAVRVGKSAPVVFSSKTSSKAAASFSSSAPLRARDHAWEMYSVRISVIRLPALT